MVDFNDNRSTTSQTSNVKLNTPAVSLTNQLRDGVESILIIRTHQSSEPQIWSSGDNQQTQQLFRQAYETMSNYESTSQKVPEATS